MSRILVTGSSKGIGHATAKELAARGHEVIATARNPETLHDLEVAAKLALDVTDEHSVAAAVAAAGRIDVLVNNAGDIAFGPLESIPFEEVRRLYELNVFGTLRMIQAVTPQMRERKSGTILNMSSQVGRVALPLTGIYCSTKWAIEGLSESLRIELGHFGCARDRDRARPDGHDRVRCTAQVLRGRRSVFATRGIAHAARERGVDPAGGGRPRDRGRDCGQDRPVSLPAGGDARAVLALRTKLDDDAFYPEFRRLARLDW